MHESDKREQKENMHNVREMLDWLSIHPTCSLGAKQSALSFLEDAANSQIWFSFFMNLKNTYGKWADVYKPNILRLKL